MLVPVGILTMYVILCLLDGIVGVFEREHGVGVHEVGEVLVGLRPCSLVLSDL